MYKGNANAFLQKIKIELDIKIYNCYYINNKLVMLQIDFTIDTVTYAETCLVNNNSIFYYD